MDLHPKRLRRIRLYVGFVALGAVLLYWELIALGEPFLPTRQNWAPVLLFSVLLFLGESQPRLWMRWGDQGMVTPGWAFAYALVLVGTPVGAILVMVCTNLYVDARHRKGLLKVVFNVSQAAFALSLGGLILHVFGVRGGIAGLDSLPWNYAVGILVAGIATFVMNGVLIGLVICIQNAQSPRSLIDREYAVTMAADGALLALAPVFVLAVEYSSLMLPLLGITAFLVYQSARSVLRSEHEANHDPLTMLLNRRAFDEHLGRALDDSDSGRRALVLVMDLDRFKDINDRLGHPIGDRLLRSFAERLERILPPTAAASRLGGDEFAVLLPSAPAMEEARELVAGWLAVLSEPHNLSGFPVTSKVSIGAAIAPDHGRTTAALLAAADLAMYRAKHFQTGLEFATSADGQTDIGRVSLLTDLQVAIGTSQIFAHYQPLVRLTDGTIESVEALVRWEHPVYGSIPPNDFIGMTEHTDLIGPLTEAMFRNSMTELLSLGADMPRLCLNVAAKSLVDRQFATSTLRIMDELGFPADHLEIEIIERDIVTNSERSLLTLTTLREHGIRVAIDDFGTGYSSFLTLRDLHADRLKIDQQFTKHIIGSAADSLIVTKLIEIAHTLGLDVVAEGVESDEVWDLLSSLGCDVAQGYAIARPMPLGELRPWLAAHTPRKSTRPLEPAAFADRIPGRRPVRPELMSKVLIA